MSLDMFRTYTEGYLSQRAKQLTEPEIDNLAFSARYITYEQVLRFLMDYLDGSCARTPSTNCSGAWRSSTARCVTSYGRRWPNTDKP